MSLFPSAFFSLFASDPWLFSAQIGIGFAVFLLIFFLLYTLRDILLRTRSFWAQSGSILLVVLLPVAGFFLYLLVRPARTIKDREMEAMLRALAYPDTPSISS